MFKKVFICSLFMCNGDAFSQPICVDADESKENTTQHWIIGENFAFHYPGIILGTGSANERRHYYVTPSHIGRACTQNDSLLLDVTPLTGVVHISHLLLGQGWSCGKGSANERRRYSSSHCLSPYPKWSLITLPNTPRGCCSTYHISSSSDRRWSWFSVQRKWPWSSTTMSSWRNPGGASCLLICNQKNMMEYDEHVAWGWDKMAATLQTTFSKAFSWMKIYEFSIEISLKIASEGPINNIPALI